MHHSLQLTKSQMFSKFFGKMRQNSSESVKQDGNRGGRAEKGHNKSLSTTRRPAFTVHDKWTDVMSTHHGHDSHDSHPSALRCTRRATDLLTFKVAGGAATPPAGTQPVSVCKG